MNFQYKIIDASIVMTLSAAALNALGSDGWELIVHDSINRTYILKKSLP